MVMCPLTLDECNKSILPRPKMAFVMAPSRDKVTPRLSQLIAEVESILSRHSLRSLEGSEIIDFGDYLCSICKNIQGCALGIAISGPDIPADALSNIFWEAGFMQGFGKPVILMADDKVNLPSDFARSFTVFFNRQDYQAKLSSLVEALVGRRDYYVHTLGDLALEARDYEKAGRYYMEAYLIGADSTSLGRVGKVTKMLKRDASIPYGYKRRLLDNLSAFNKEASRGSDQGLI